MSGKPSKLLNKLSGPVSQRASEDFLHAFAEALRSHKAGQLKEAERFYKKALSIESVHADSIHFLGVIAYQTRNYEKAIELIGKAIAIDPASAAFHSNLGNALRNSGRLEEAAASYLRAIELNPYSANNHNNLGLVLHALGRHDEAAANYGQAIALKADLPEAHNNLSLVLKDQGKLEAAATSSRRALALRPEFPEAYNNLGIAQHEQRQLAEAVISYGKALDLKPNFAEVHNNLANALKDQGRFGEAQASFKKAIQLGADPCVSYYGLSGCRKFSEADGRVIDALNALLNDPNIAESGRTLLHFALGKIYDDLALYGKAIVHFDEANRIEHQKHRHNGPELTAFVNWSIEAFRKDAFNAPIVSDSELPIFIVGMPRSGTTLTEQILARHPVVMAGGELTFWFQTLDMMRRQPSGQAAQLVEQGLVGDYLSLLKAISPSASRVTDKMPYNFLILGLIHRLFPRARIIHLRRSPVDTALSIYFTRFTRVNDFAYSRRDIVDYHQQYRRLMEHWRALLPPEQFIEIDYESLVADQEAVTRRLIAFCGLGWDNSCLSFHKAKNPISTASAWQARQPLYRTSIQRWRHYEPWLGEFRELLQFEPVVSRESGARFEVPR